MMMMVMMMMGDDDDGDDDDDVVLLLCSRGRICVSEFVFGQWQVCSATLNHCSHPPSFKKNQGATFFVDFP
jgi:hypothetical protein